ncbi:hypothetical protein [Haematomicrobium sanguinis]|uniref:hypothetical protein n=1 Tax=Haematomicrobium sanguinis TaxID=479106 RepID=UPI00047ABA28|nr:hypothetical protein [Haematomicrobium sanguinis]
MTDNPQIEGGQHLVGHNRISSQALESTAKFAASEALGIEAERIRAQVADDGGNLALSLSLPVVVTSLERPVPPGPSGWQRINAAKGTVADRVSQLTGSRVARVDIRVTGAHINEGARIQ